MQSDTLEMPYREFLSTQSKRDVRLPVMDFHLYTRVGQLVGEEDIFERPGVIVQERRNYS